MVENTNTNSMSLKEFIFKLSLQVDSYPYQSNKSNRIIKIQNNIITHLWLSDYKEKRQISPISLAEISSFLRTLFSLKHLSIVNYPNLSLDFICTLIHLEEIWLKYSNYKKFHTYLDQLQKLRTFNGDGNQLSEIPKGLLHLPHLENMYLNDNNIISVPDKLQQLKSLRILELRENLFKNSFPDGILSIPNLESLHLGGCQIQELPEDIGILKSMKNLQLGSNSISELPESLQSLKQLEMLYLRNNQLDKIPKWILKLPSLKIFLLEGNPGFKKFIKSPLAQSLMNKGCMLSFFHKIPR